MLEVPVASSTLLVEYVASEPEVSAVDVDKTAGLVVELDVVIVVNTSLPLAVVLTKSATTAIDVPETSVVSADSLLI